MEMGIKCSGRRIIFLDIDGTLTEPGRSVPPESAVDAIRRARENGHLVFLCTGRNLGMLSPLLRYGFDGVVASAGGYVMCQGKVIYDCPMTEEQSRRAMEVLERNGVYRTAECRDGSYTDKEFREYLKMHDTKEGNSELIRMREQIEKSLNILPMEEYSGLPVYKIGFMSPSRERLVEPMEVLSDEFQFCIQDMGDLPGIINGELINRKFNKGKAVERVLSCVGMEVSDSIAFGDSMNDMEMLKTAGVGICMRDGNQELKRIADDICPGVGEDGIRIMFQKYGLC